MKTQRLATTSHRHLPEFYRIELKYTLYLAPYGVQRKLLAPARLPLLSTCLEQWGMSWLQLIRVLYQPHSRPMAFAALDYDLIRVSSELSEASMDEMLSGDVVADEAEEAATAFALFLYTFFNRWNLQRSLRVQCHRSPLDN